MVIDRTNKDKAEDAKVALTVHSAICGTKEEECKTQLSDLLINLCHFCAENNIDWNSLIENATDVANMESLEDE